MPETQKAPWCRIPTKLAAVRHGPFKPVYWWTRKHPDPAVTAYAPGPFRGDAAEITAATLDGWQTTFCDRDDACDRPSLYAPRAEVLRRWPRLVTLIEVSSALSEDEASYALWGYMQGADGGLFGKRYCEIVSYAVLCHFGYGYGGSIPVNGKAYWQRFYGKMLRDARAIKKRDSVETEK